jgi:16S rRNA (adenine1518-N6/adenine1519-N6)-dimethyltransferase
MTVAPRFADLNVEEEPFIAFLKVSFGQKRKTLANNLKARYDEHGTKAAIKSAGVRADARAEALGLEKMAAIFRALHSPAQV